MDTMMGPGEEEGWEVDHEGMRRLILSRFEDDVLLRDDVEMWLDTLSVPGEDPVFEDGMLGQCYCSCEGCKDCGREAEDMVGVSPVEVEVELVPGMKFMAFLGLRGRGRKRGKGARRHVACCKNGGLCSVRGGTPEQS